jgi:hypothetical protein
MLIHAAEFLMMSPHQSIEHVSEEEIRRTLLSEIDASLPDAMGTSASNRVSSIEADLKPILQALPKNAYGNLEHPVAHYGLHRLFVLRHGWNIKGLGPTSGKYNASSPAGILKDQVPVFIEDLFVQRLGRKGFKLHDLAVLAATIEHLIQEEALQRLAAAFKVHDTAGKGVLPATEVPKMLDTYMSSFILSENLTDMTADKAEKLRREIPENFMYWKPTQEFSHGIYKKFFDAATYEDPHASRTDLVALTKVGESVSEQFGSFFHNTVCGKMKHDLMSMEYGSTGRIKLSDFYKPALNGSWQFQESVGYLRELGVLEETESKEPRVMIANYMLAPANCIATSGFYTVCCKNECDALLGQLERKIAAPEADPMTIAAIVADLPSATVSAPRTLSASVLERLQVIASSHGGTVPIHGRLFAQWLHQAYPRECPYPHISGTTTPTLPEEWYEASGSDVIASDEEMRQYIQWSSNSSRVSASVEDLMTWSSEEELLVVRPASGSSEFASDLSTTTPGSKKSMLLLSFAGSLAYAVIQAMKTAQMSPQNTPKNFAI